MLCGYSFLSITFETQKKVQITYTHSEYTIIVYCRALDCFYLLGLVSLQTCYVFDWAGWTWCWNISRPNQVPLNALRYDLRKSTWITKAPLPFHWWMWALGLLQQCKSLEDSLPKCYLTLFQGFFTTKNHRCCFVFALIFDKKSMKKHNTIN